MANKVLDWDFVHMAWWNASSSTLFSSDGITLMGFCLVRVMDLGYVDGMEMQKKQRLE